MKRVASKYPFVRERAVLFDDQRLAALREIGTDEVSFAQDIFARIWATDPILSTAQKRAIEFPLHWFLIQKCWFGHETWSNLPEWWLHFLNQLEFCDRPQAHISKKGAWLRQDFFFSEDANFDEPVMSLSGLADEAELLDWAFGHAEVRDLITLGNRRFDRIIISKINMVRPNTDGAKQARTGLLDTFQAFKTAEPLRNYLLFELFEGTVAGGGFEQWIGPSRRKRCKSIQKVELLEKTEQAEVFQQAAHFFDYALPVVRERFGLRRAVRFLKDEKSGLFNFWLCRKAPSIAVKMGISAPFSMENPLVRVNSRLPLKRLPQLLLHDFGTENGLEADVAHVALGGSLRDLPGLQRGEETGRLSPRVAHILSEMEPVDMTFWKAVQYARCLAVWPNEDMAYLVAHCLEEGGYAWYFNLFVEEIMRFLHRNEAALAEIRTWDLLRFIVSEKAERPDFSLRGRTVAALLRQMEARERELAIYEGFEGKPRFWPPSGFAGFEKRGENGVVFQIVEITSLKEIIEEGREMSHCVANYARNCADGEYSIWSLRRIKDSQLRRLVTIGVEKDGRIRAVSGYSNNEPHNQDIYLIAEWAEQAGLICFHYSFRVLY